jgi:hypothetical protein
MKYINIFILILSLFILLNSCSRTNEISRDKEYSEKGYTIGTVIDNSKIAGCGFLIQLNDSSIIAPSKLEDKFRKNNLKVYFKYEVLKKQPMTNCMRGKVANITEIMEAKRNKK